MIAGKAPDDPRTVEILTELAEQLAGILGFTPTPDEMGVVLAPGGYAQAFIMKTEVRDGKEEFWFRFFALRQIDAEGNTTVEELFPPFYIDVPDRLVQLEEAPKTPKATSFGPFGQRSNLH